MNGPRTDHPISAALLMGIGALACATLLLESALLRLLSVSQFYHFAFLVVSLALLGFGASGSLLSISPWLRSRSLPDSLALGGGGFALSTGGAYAVVNLLPFDSYAIAWERRQVIFFVLYYFALTIPFVFSGIGIGAGLAKSGKRSHHVYASNLLGSGLGALFAPLMLWLAGVPGAVLGSACLALLAAFRYRLRLPVAATVFAGVLALGGLAYQNLQGRMPLDMTISPYKGLSYAMQYPGSRRLYGGWNAISRVDVIAEAGTRLLPGLSYTYPGVPPPQHGLSVDADSIQPISLVSVDDFTASAYLPEALAYQLRPGGKVLVLEPGAGLGVLQALAGGAEQVTAVLGNPQLYRAVADTASEYNVYDHPRVRTVRADARVHLERTPERYTLVALPLTDGFRPVTSGAYSLAENFLLTVESFREMLLHLEPGGILVVTRWLQTPPSESVRLIATLAQALEETGEGRPQDAIVAYRGIQTITVLVQPGGWSVDEMSEVRRFMEARRYDLVWAQDLAEDEVNRFNRLPEPSYYLAIAAMLASDSRQAFFESYPFSVEPARDDHPFFFHFFRWEQTPQVLALLGRTWQPFGGSGYFVLLAMLGLALLLSVLLILGPLLVRSSLLRKRIVGFPRGKVVLYFSALGLGFLFVEIPLIQRWILLLGHPTYAFSAVVLAVLSFSSLGSALARSGRLPHRTALAALVILTLVSPWALDRLVDATLGWSTPARLAIGITGLAPMSVLMGLPFPLGLAWLERQKPDYIPWAWAVNGCASVIGAVLAAIIALSAGFKGVLLLGSGAYTLAWWIYSSMVRS